jgi:hypothetical protein
MRARRQRRLALAAPWLLLVAACSGELELRGTLDRVIGETVTVELVEGGSDLTGQATLVGSNGARFGPNALKLKQPAPRTLTFVSPMDVPAGAARLEVGRADGGPPYMVSLQINRLALALDIRGTLDLFPLPAASVKRTTQALGSGQGQISLTPQGEMLASVVGGNLRLISVGSTAQGLKLTNLAAPIKQPGALYVSAVPGGALVGSDSEVVFFKLDRGIKQVATFAIKGCKDIASDRQGARAVVLSACDTDNSGSVDSDCLTELRLGTSPGLVRTLAFDRKPDAVAVGIALGGGKAVAVDPDGIWGFFLGDPKAIRSNRVPWGFSAAPTDLDRTAKQQQVNNRAVDVFAVSESSRKTIWVVAFDGQRLKRVLLGDRPLQVPTSAAPTRLAFGRRMDLYFAAGNTLYMVQDLGTQPRVRGLGLTTTNNIASLEAQP